MIDHTRLNEMRNREFSKSFRGYDPGEVDEFVESLLFETGQLIDGLSGMEQRLKESEEARDGLKSREDLLSSTLVAARSTAEDWKDLARREAEQILREAHSEAEDLLRKTRHRQEEEETVRSRELADFLLRIARVKGEFSALKDAVDRWSDAAEREGGTFRSA